MVNLSSQIIDELFELFDDIRYVAIYQNGDLTYKQKTTTPDSSSESSDKFEELLVNPILLTAARQRGNIDCGGLRFLVVAYGNFYQLLKEISNGHISICLSKSSDLNMIPDAILNSIKLNYPQLN